VFCLSPYSPNFNSIEEVFSKIEGILRRAEARTGEALIKAKAKAISAVGATDVGRFFKDCGYGPSGQ
jgi:hypothetical protein